MSNEINQVLGVVNFINRCMTNNLGLSHKEQLTMEKVRHLLHTHLQANRSKMDCMKLVSG